MADKTAISQLSELSKQTTKNIGFLRRKKEQIEFRIATEAFSVQAEKDLIRKKNEIDAELEQSLKSYRLRKKLEFIDKDIADFGKRITELDAKIKESDKKLDELYSNLRALTGDAKRKARPEGAGKKREQPKLAEISMADIVAMKDKKDDSEDKGDFDESVLN